ncbi:MAG: helix-turn-helix domain-containing protein [Sterolibacteriaceae bacterium]|uniref:Helix-turn-helix domain-containing protein n=1 Tax=Candidatus Methylophosphatis roskildensis TaxID=2899263 RepID=A0A9D7HK11_9PROT|nr:helix-turn-helix domain-containing protein [Candidatus Methylophosphatis roskildensis]MBK7234490.1 helix-turn-helix domain-containing protein [Sterolibacteriaceae bacterium]
MDTRKELGEFLQAARSRQAPEAFGFPAGSRRRTQGLRREEVAQLAGISPTWYTWIEQGRPVNVSADALERLAQGLHLTRGERAYIFELAGRRDPLAAAPESDAAADLLISLVANIAIPAYILGRTWDMLAWNKPAAALFAGWLDQRVRESELPRNLLRYVFLAPGARALIVDWETRAGRLVAEFRADCRTRLDEPALVRLIDDLKKGSPEFARFWKQHNVLERQGGRRDFNHCRRGLVSYQQVTLKPVDQDQLKLVLLKPDRA